MSQLKITTEQPPPGNLQCSSEIDSCETDHSFACAGGHRKSESAKRIYEMFVLNLFLYIHIYRERQAHAFFFHLDLFNNTIYGD